MNLANKVNRYNFDKAAYTELQLRVQKNSRWHPFVREFKPVLKNNRIYINNLPVLVENEVPRIVAWARLRTDAPMGMESLHKWISTRVALGVRRRHLKEILRKDPMFENLQRRGDRHVPERRYKKEGLTRRVFEKTPHALATDLIAIGDKMFSTTKYRGTYRFILVVVHKYSGFAWGRLMRNKKPKTITSSIAPIIADATKQFGHPGLIERDMGKEFSNEYLDLLKELKIEDKPLKKAYVVETKNSIIQRAMVELEKQFAITKNLEISLQKSNNTPNRTIGGASPLDVYENPKNMKKKYPKKYKTYKHKHKTRRTRKFEVGQKVRYLLKKAHREDPQNYKSYTKHYSAETHTVKWKRGDRYRINKIPYVLKADELIDASAELKPLSSELAEESKEKKKKLDD